MIKTLTIIAKKQIKINRNNLYNKIVTKITSHNDAYCKYSETYGKSIQSF